MKHITTKASICLKDDFGIEYLISDIQYTEWENEEFEYIFRPVYSVIDLLDSTLFQGIPGIHLETRQKTYIRKNMIPTFISERSPGRNREDLWKHLNDCDMDYLNQLEWLIRTDTKYIGDRLYVRSHKESENIMLSDKGLKRSIDILHRLLTYICAGDEVTYDVVVIHDENRKMYYDLIYQLYKKENGYIRTQQKKGIQEAKQKGKYKGRKPIEVDDTRLDEVIRKFEKKKISADQAANLLNMSRPTFYRRMRKYKES